MEITVIDNFVGKYTQDYLEDTLLSFEFPLFLNRSTVLGGVDYMQFTDSNTVDIPQFIHNFVKNYNFVSNWTNLVIPLYLRLCEHLNQDYDLLRCKFNLNVPHPSVTGEKYYTPHVDTDLPDSIVGIYYVNDSDGDTLFFNSDKEIIKRVTPKKGTMVCFDNTVYHAGQSPISTDVRGVINFNLIAKGLVC